MWESAKRYAEHTASSTYTLVLVAPFLATYELGLVALRLSSEEFRARNGADAIIRSVLFPLGIQRSGSLGAFLWSLVSALVLAACFLAWRATEKNRRPLEPRYAGWLFAEAAGWALLLFLASSLVSLVLPDCLRLGTGAAGPGVLAEMVFNAGAGVYEEFVFRVILVLLLALFFTKVVHLDRVQGGVAAAVASAVLFSLVHFGAGADGPAWGGEGFWALFLFRAGAGLFFSLLFYFRSFGLAVASHALYDNMITLAQAGA